MITISMHIPQNLHIPIKQARPEGQDIDLIESYNKREGLNSLIRFIVKTGDANEDAFTRLRTTQQELVLVSKVDHAHFETGVDNSDSLPGGLIISTQGVFVFVGKDPDVDRAFKSIGMANNGSDADGIADGTRTYEDIDIYPLTDIPDPSKKMLLLLKAICPAEILAKVGQRVSEETVILENLLKSKNEEETMKTVLELVGFSKDLDDRGLYEQIKDICTE